MIVDLVVFLGQNFLPVRQSLDKMAAKVLMGLTAGLTIAGASINLRGRGRGAFWG